MKNPAFADPMRFRRSLPIVAAVLAIAAVVALIVALRKQAAPEAARLLPGADGFLYVELDTIRKLSTAPLPPVSHDPEYQKFVDETGFEFERDLDKAAFAIHYPESWGNGTAGSSPEPRFSEIFVGKFDSSRLTSYLRKTASSVDSYRNFDIYNIPLEGRTVRVAVLSYDSVAVSNHPDPAVIRAIVDRSRKLASPFGGPSLLRKFYGHVPLASLAFAILRIQPSEMNSSGSLANLSLVFSKPAVVVFSARTLRALHLRAEAFAGDESEAEAIANKATSVLSLFHAAEGNVGAHGTDADIKAFFDSLKVEHSGDSAILTATAPSGLIGKILSEAPASEAPPPLQPSPAGPSTNSANPKKR
jgi:hypothetical protein